MNEFIRKRKQNLMTDTQYYKCTSFLKKSFPFSCWFETKSLLSSLQRALFQVKHELFWRLWTQFLSWSLLCRIVKNSQFLSFCFNRVSILISMRVLAYLRTQSYQLRTSLDSTYLRHMLSNDYTNIRYIVLFLLFLDVLAALYCRVW